MPLPRSRRVPSMGLLHFLRAQVAESVAGRTDASRGANNVAKWTNWETKKLKSMALGTDALTASRRAGSTNLGTDTAWKSRTLRAGGTTSWKIRSRSFSTARPELASAAQGIIRPDFFSAARSWTSHPREAGDDAQRWSGTLCQSTAGAPIKPARLIERGSVTPTRRFLAPQSVSRSPRRHGHGDARPWLQRLAELARSGDAAALAKLRQLQPDDLPGPPSAPTDPTGTIFGRSKAATELKLRCTEFDEHGKVVLVNGEFKKTELIAKYGLLPRDLRKIDSSLLPSILVRPSSILVNLLHLRLLIQHNRVLIFDAWGSSNTYAQSMFMYDLEGKLGSKEASRSATSLPYEFRALEAVLISVTSGLEAEYEGIRDPVSRVLRELEEDIDRDTLRHLLVYSKKLGTFEQKARLVRDAIDALLDEDEDLSAMYLTETAQGVERDEADHTEIEMLLESYHKVADEIVQNSSNLVTNIRNTEEIIRAILDANRNALMLLDLKFSIGTLGMGSGAFIAALYGMNLKSFLEESEWGFVGIGGFSATLVAVVCVYGMRQLRRVQRMRMWGERGATSLRGSWRDLDRTAGLPGEQRAERMQRLKEERAAAWNRKSEAKEVAMK